MALTLRRNKGTTSASSSPVAGDNGTTATTTEAAATATATSTSWLRRKKRRVSTTISLPTLLLFLFVSLFLLLAGISMLSQNDGGSSSHILMSEEFKYFVSDRTTTTTRKNNNNRGLSYYYNNNNRKRTKAAAAAAEKQRQKQQELWDIYLSRIQNHPWKHKPRPRIVQAVPSNKHGYYSQVVTPISPDKVPVLEGKEVEPDYHYHLLERKKRLHHEEEAVDSCEPLDSWQEASFPTCNFFHEYDLKNFWGPEDLEERSSELSHKKHNHKNDITDWTRLLGNGAFRDVWLATEMDIGSPSSSLSSTSTTTSTTFLRPLALKTNRYTDRRKFDFKTVDRNRRDAVAMEQLSSSPRVVDVYGYCAMSAFNEFSHGGDLYDLWEHEPNPAPLRLLELAHSFAAALSDAHAVSPNDGRARIAHTDIKPDQFLRIDIERGEYKLNDFNRCRFLKWDFKDDEYCPFLVAKNGGVWRSPEEYAYEEESEKVDVYSLGNVFFFLLHEGEKPFAEFSGDTEKASELVKQGIRPKGRYRRRAFRRKGRSNNTIDHHHPAIVAIEQAMDMCFTHDQYKRPSAAQVAEFLKEQLDKQRQNEASEG